MMFQLDLNLRVRVSIKQHKVISNDVTERSNLDKKGGIEDSFWILMKVNSQQKDETGFRHVFS